MFGSVAMYATTTSQDQYRMELEIAHPFKFCKPLNSSNFNCLFLIPLKLFQASWYCEIFDKNLGSGNLVRDLSYNDLSGEIPYNIGYLQVSTL